jgi:hypothetical protein
MGVRGQIEVSVPFCGEKATSRKCTQTVWAPEQRLHVVMKVQSLLLAYAESRILKHFFALFQPGTKLRSAVWDRKLSKQLIKRPRISAVKQWITVPVQTDAPANLSLWNGVVTIKVKFSPYKPWRPLGLREVEAPTFSDIRLIDGGKVGSAIRRPLFTPQENSWYSFLLEAESTPWP